MARTELDLDHITAVCDRLTQTRVAVGLNIAPTRRGYAISATTNVGARRVEAAFTRLGYRANVPERFGHRDQVTITGWSLRGLESRVTALEKAVAWLRSSRGQTAADAIDHGLPSQRDLHDSLRATVERSTGVITDHALDVRPEDRDCAQLLQTVHRLEHDAADHIRLHVQAAETAVHLYRQYQPGMANEQARAIAITTASTHGPPPGWPNAPDQDHTKNPVGPTSPGSAASTGTTAASAAPADLGEHPATIAAHDHPGDATTDATHVQIVPTDAPPPPAVASNRQGPVRGPTTH